MQYKKSIASNKVIFFGTSEFAVPALVALQATRLDSEVDPRRAGYQLQAVITQPDKPKGRKQVLSPSPVKVMAQKFNLQVLQYSTLKSPEVIEKIKSFDAVCAVVASYGKIIPQEILTAFPKGCINLHPSLLPKYRGPSPIQTAIFNGDSTTGTSIMVLDAELDHGPILAQKKIKIAASDTYLTLHNKLAEISTELLVKVLPRYLSGKVTITAQNHKKATFTKLLTRQDGKIDWRRSAPEIHNQIRAFTPWPGTWAVLNGKRLKILRAHPATALDQKLNPGEVSQKSKKILIGCGLNGVLEVGELQLEGKIAMSVQAFLKENEIEGVKFL